MSTYNNRRNYNGNKRRRSGGNSKGSNFWQIALTLVTIMLVFSVVPVLAAIPGHTHDAANDPTEVEKISFTIMGLNCEAEKGMTFEQWVNSDYCYPEYSFEITEGELICIYGKIVNSNSELVLGSDVIEAGSVYSPE